MEIFVKFFEFPIISVSVKRCTSNVLMLCKNIYIERKAWRDVLV